MMTEQVAAMCEHGLPVRRALSGIELVCDAAACLLAMEERYEREKAAREVAEKELAALDKHHHETALAAAHDLADAIRAREAAEKQTKESEEILHEWDL